MQLVIIWNDVFFNLFFITFYFYLFILFYLFFFIKSIQMLEKNGKWWVRDKENMVDEAKSHIPRQ